LSLRVSPETRDKLLAAARASGHSLTTEVEIRLGQSFERQALVSEIMGLLFGEGLAGLVMLIGRAMRQAGLSVMREKRQFRGWLADPDAYDAAATAALRVLDEFRPEGSVAANSQKTGEIFAYAHITEVVNEGAPYRFDERSWIDLTRTLLGRDLMAQSRWLKSAAAEDAAILAARTAAESSSPDDEDPR